LRRATEAAQTLYDAARLGNRGKDANGIPAESALRVLRELHDAVRRARDLMADPKIADPK
jgi:hypothetical protein